MKRFALLLLLAGSAFGQYVATTFNKGTGGGTPPALVDVSQATLPNTASGTAVATLGTAATAGELGVVVSVGIAGSNDLSSCTDSASDSFTSAFVTNDTGQIATGGWIQILYVSSMTAGVTTVTCTETNGNGSFFFYHFKKNGSITGTLDQTASAVGGMVSGATYTSGITATGTATQTCDLASFNGGGSGATATVALTGTNTIASGTSLVFTAPGANYSSLATTATA